MDHANFRQFRNQIFELYQSGEYKQALELIESQLDRFPDEATQTHNWRVCLAAMMGQPKMAIRMLAESLEQGLWWPEDALHEDPDLKTLQGMAEFERLVTACAEKHRQALLASKPELVTLLPAAPVSRPAPLLVAIHGRNNNAGQFAEYWQDLTDQGWIVALPQSSQILGTGVYGWDDFDLAEMEIIDLFNALCKEHAVDPSRVILSGFSQGGALAILLSLAGRIPARGFIAVAPSIRSLERLAAIPQIEHAQRLRGYMITGGKDHGAELVLQIQSTLKARSVRYQLEHHPDLGHEFPPHFERSVKQALAFIFESTVRRNETKR